MIEHCSTCTHFEPLSEKLGYCTFLGVMIEKGVALMDTNPMIDIVRDRDVVDQQTYNFIIVESAFGCVCHKRIRMQ